MKKVTHFLLLLALVCITACSVKEQLQPEDESTIEESNKRQAVSKTIYGTSNSDFIEGTSLSEEILAYAADDQVYANAGDDVIYGGKGNDFLQGNSGSDIIRGDRGLDKLYGGTGNDDLYGGKDNDDLHGEDGNDHLYGDKGNDMLYGGLGNDNYYYALYGGYDVISDDGGSDLLFLEGISANQVAVSYSGSDVVLNVPSGRITIKNSSIEGVYANGQSVGIGGNSPTPSIGQFYYSSAPLEVNTNEEIVVNLSESSNTSISRSYAVEVVVQRSSGSWVIASGNMSINAGSTQTSRTFTSQFNQTGQIYTTIKVYNANKTKLLASRQGTYPDNIGGGSNYITGVPYYWQLDNSVYPYSSCQNTAIAMVINYYGGNTTPDQITNYYGKNQAQTVPGFQSVFNSEAAYAGLNVRDAGTQYGSLSQLNRLLSEGKPVMAHGYTTSYGHLVVFLGFDGTYYYVNDPYGAWDGRYGSSGYYKTRTVGKAVKYHKDDVRAAFAPDGYVWLHEIYFM
ncbi:C39 family peptidase [Flammeovirga sp. SJP92]|uniref:C39 family peptidase n=1 Tax=Flammeovirga sp. SJP92 TaxID=1775430 RepID=UPI000787B453|nr:C39 family peptidase [Flammeovirga sp. SJP92]KXX69375.1 hypothetical protein AVL50_19480 [Flammeovirga sp. SJP92]